MKKKITVDIEKKRAMTIEKKTDSFIENLRRENQIYRELFQNTHQIIWRLDLHTYQLTFVSPAVRYLGYTVEEVINSDPKILVTPETVQLIAKIITEELKYYTITKERRIREIELSFYNKKKDIKWFFTTLVLITDERGEPVELQAISHDITERKQIEEELKASEERFRSLIYSMSEGVWVCTLEGETIFVNPSICKMLGYSSDELIGRSAIEFVAPEHIPLFIEKNSTRLKGIDESNSYEIHLIKKTGELVPFRVTGKILFDGNDEPFATFGIFRNIAEEKRLRDLQDKFITMTSHELRTPVTVIRGYIELLLTRTDLPSEIRRDYYSKILNNTQRLIDLINKVHDVNAIKANIFRIEPKPVDEEFDKLLWEHFCLMYPDRLIFINYFVDTEVPKGISNKPMYFDKERIMQVLENLISNAVKHSPKESPIEINIIRKTKELVICCQDYGAGIPHKTIFSLFTPFSYSPSRYSHQGTGLGLYIVRKIVGAHHGRIGLITREGEGTIFTVIIPITKD